MAGIVFGRFWIFAIIPKIIANLVLHLAEDRNLFTDDAQREPMQRVLHVQAMLAARKDRAREADPVA